jgi:hypothetical protein
METRSVGGEIVKWSERAFWFFFVLAFSVVSIKSFSLYAYGVRCQENIRRDNEDLIGSVKDLQQMAVWVLETNKSPVFRRTLRKKLRRIECKVKRAER